MYYTRPLVKHWWKKPSNVAVNGSRHSTYVAHPSPACCMSIGRWTNQLNCSGSCRHVTDFNLFSPCTCCFHSHFGTKCHKKPNVRSRKINLFLQQKENSPKRPQSDETHSRPPPNEVNASDMSESVISVDAITLAPIPSISGNVQRRDKFFSKHLKVNSKHFPLSLWKRKNSSDIRVPSQTVPKQTKEIVKSELIFTTNPDVMKIIGTNAMADCKSSTFKSVHGLNDSVDSGPLANYNIRPNSNQDGEIFVGNHQSPSDQIIHSSEHSPIVYQKPCLESPISKSDHLEDENTSEVLPETPTSNSIVVNFHSIRKTKLPKVKSYGIASSKLITEVVEVTPKAHGTSKCSQEVSALSSSSSQKQRSAEKNRFKTKKLTPKTVITTDIYI